MKISSLFDHCGVVAVSHHNANQLARARMIRSISIHNGVVPMGSPDGEVTFLPALALEDRHSQRDSLPKTITFDQNLAATLHKTGADDGSGSGGGAKGATTVIRRVTSIRPGKCPGFGVAGWCSTWRRRGPDFSQPFHACSRFAAAQSAERWYRTGGKAEKNGAVGED